MDAVWSWDNWFNLVAIAPADPALAMDQALLMADHQDAHGCYPDSVDADGALYCFNKPPVQGVLLRRLRRTDPRFLTPARRAALFATLAPATRWWLDHRRWPGRRLCHYRHGNDSGWDNSTMFDEGAPLEAPDLNALLAVQAAELARLADGLGHARQAASWTRIARDLRRDLLADLWDGDGFAAVRLPEGRRVRCRSLIPLMPLVLGRDLPEDVRDRLVAAVPGFVTDHGLATEAPDSPDHVTDGYWRGPIWGPSTLLVVDALRDLGEDALATRIATGFCRTCVRHGFAENFAAATGAPLRDPAYTWTAAAYLCLARDLGRPRADRAGA
jgi:glycogen debranching enzyme